MMQTRLTMKKTTFQVSNGFVLDSKQKQGQITGRTGVKKTNERQIIPHKENHTKKIANTYPMEPEKNISRFYNKSKSLDRRLRNDKRYEKQFEAPSKLGHFRSNQNLKTEISKSVFNKRSCLTKSQNSKGNKTLSRIRVRREFSEIIPQPSAFVHILSAFIAGTSETNFKYGCGNLGSRRALSRMLENVPEETEPIEESYYNELVTSRFVKESNKSIATYISPIEFSTNKSSSTTGYELIIKDILETSSFKNEYIWEEQIPCEYHALEKDPGVMGENETNDLDFERISQCNIKGRNFDPNKFGEGGKLNTTPPVRSRLETTGLGEGESVKSSLVQSQILPGYLLGSQSSAESSLRGIPRAIAQKCEAAFTERDFQFPSRNLTDSWQHKQIVNGISIRNNKEYLNDRDDRVSKIENPCKRIESLFRSKCTGDESKEKCSVSCPCLSKIHDYQVENLYVCIPPYGEDVDEIQEINSNSEIFRNEDLVKGGCETRYISENNIGAENPRDNRNVSYERLDNSKLEHNIHQSVKRNENRPNEFHEFEERIQNNSRKLYAYLSKSCTKIEQKRVEGSRNCGEKYSVITLFSNRNKMKTSRGIKKRRTKYQAEQPERDSIVEMEIFKKEVLDFFDHNMSEQQPKDKFEDLTVPSAELIIPKFSQVFTDIEKTTKEKINYFLENPEMLTQQKFSPHEDNTELIVLYMPSIQCS